MRAISQAQQQAFAAIAQAFAPQGVTSRVYGAKTTGPKPSEYKGEIVAITDGMAIQKLNDKGSFVAHVADSLAVGDKLAIRYTNDVRVTNALDQLDKAPTDDIDLDFTRENALPQADAPVSATLDSNAPRVPKPEGKRPSSRNTVVKKTMAEIDNEKYKAVADRIVKSIEEGNSIWQKPWKGASSQSRPHNAQSTLNYQGVNRVLLMTEMAARGSSDTRFMTYKQCEALAETMQKNGTPEDKLPHVKKGSESIDIYKFGRSIHKSKVLDDGGKPVKDADGKDKIKEARGRSFLQTHRVFHASDIEHLPPMEITEPKQAWVIHAQCEDLVSKMGVEVRYEPDNRAYYEPLRDRITMPERSQFVGKTPADAQNAFYSVLLHEASHASGHKSRLNRSGITEFSGFGSTSYAYEELVAETSSTFVLSSLGLPNDEVIERHNSEDLGLQTEGGIARTASYLSSWVAKIKEDPKALFKAFNEAEQAADFVMQRHASQLALNPELGNDVNLDFTKSLAHPTPALDASMESDIDLDFTKPQANWNTLKPVDLTESPATVPGLFEQPDYQQSNDLHLNRSMHG